jgi:hypothetical protein
MSGLRPSLPVREQGPSRHNLPSYLGCSRARSAASMDRVSEVWRCQAILAVPTDSLRCSGLPGWQQPDRLGPVAVKARLPRPLPIDKLDKNSKKRR